MRYPTQSWKIWAIRVQRSQSDCGPLSSPNMANGESIKAQISIVWGHLCSKHTQSRRVVSLCVWSLLLLSSHREREVCHNSQMVMLCSTAVWSLKQMAYFFLIYANGESRKCCSAHTGAAVQPSLSAQFYSRTQSCLFVREEPATIVRRALLWLFSQFITSSVTSKCSA